MDPLEPLDQLLRGPAAAGPAERLRRAATPPRLAMAAVVAAVLAALIVITAASPPTVEMSLPRAAASSAADEGDRSTTGDAPHAAVAAATSTTATVSAGVVVHVAGAVATPGLVQLSAGARVADAVAAAGGPAAGADVDRLNLAAAVLDGSRVFVPVVGQTEPVPIATPGVTVGGGDGPADAPPTVGPVDLNSATVDELDVLPGVGPATAAAIVAHRDENGPFLGVDELQDVRGIGPAKFEALRDLVTAGG